MSLAIVRTVLARRALGRHGLKPFREWKDGQPETEIHFKSCRQATNKTAGLAEEAAGFPDTFF